MKLIKMEKELFYSESLSGVLTIRGALFTRDQAKTRTVDGVEEAYNIYDDLISQGYELVLIPQAEKDAYEAKQAQDAINQEAIKYLNDTDKFFTRLIETGKAMPEGMAEARAEARGKIAV